MIKATVYDVDGTSVQILPNNGKSFTLKELQGVVGGLIEIIRLPETKEIIIVNEEGLLKHLPHNAVASAIWRKAYPIEKYPHNNLAHTIGIVGNAIVCPASMVR